MPMDVSYHGNRESIIRCYFRVFPPRGIASILDIGSGRTAPYKGVLSSRCSEYHALDIREGPKVDTVADMTEGAPFPDGRWEWGWSSECLEHIPPPLQERFSAEVLRICRNVTFTFPTPAHPTFWGDPGHNRVGVNWKAYKERFNLWDFSFKTGRAVVVITQKNILVKPTPTGLQMRIKE